MIIQQLYANEIPKNRKTNKQNNWKPPAKKMYQGLTRFFPHYRMPKSEDTGYLLLNNKSIDSPIVDGLNGRINFHDDPIWESSFLAFVPL